MEIYILVPHNIHTVTPNTFTSIKYINIYQKSQCKSIEFPECHRKKYKRTKSYVLLFSIFAMTLCYWLTRLLWKRIECAHWPLSICSLWGNCHCKAIWISDLSPLTWLPFFYNETSEVVTNTETWQSQHLPCPHSHSMRSHWMV